MEAAFAFLERLVAVPSVVGNEQEAQELVAAQLERLGFRARNVHGVDEAVELASIVAGVRALARLIAAWPAGGFDGRR